MIEGHIEPTVTRGEFTIACEMIDLLIAVAFTDEVILSLKAAGVEKLRRWSVMRLEDAATCRIEACPKPAAPGELCAYHAAPQDPDLVRESEREADGRHRRIG